MFADCSTVGEQDIGDKKGNNFLLVNGRMHKDVCTTVSNKENVSGNTRH